MKFTTLTQQQYEDARYQFLLTTEEQGTVKLRPYVDSRGYITIGAGFNLNSSNVRATVLAALGIQNSGTDAAFYQQLTNVLSAPHSADAAAALLELDEIMVRRTTGATFSFSNESQVKAVFSTLAPSYEALVNNRAPGVPNYTNERVVLYSLAYNTTNGNGLGQGLKAAIANGNRAEAWFEIRYNTNPKTLDSGGIAKRRHYESQTLGLYDNPIGTPTAEDAKQIYAMLNKRRDTILAYEALYGTSPDSNSAALVSQRIAAANSDYHLSGNAQVQTLYAALIPARDAFIAWLNTQLPAGEAALVASNWNPAAIGYNDPAKPLPTLDARSLDGKGNGMDKNLLVGSDGADKLYGGKGADVLIGAKDDDRLEGGAGDDTMYGGEGDDTYVIRLSDGTQHDRIVDSDGKGSIVIYDKNGNPLNMIVLKRQGTANSWTDSDGQVTISHNSPWKITLSDGSVIELGEGFDPTGFGITLQDEPALSTGTVTGDLAKDTTNGRYVLSPTGYASAGPQAGAADVLIGTGFAETLLGLGGNDGISAGAGDDLVEGGAGNDLLLGGTGFDTLNGGAGNDFIFGSAMGLVSTPTAMNFTPPAIGQGEIEAARGFSWVAGRAAGQRWNGEMASFLGIAISGANTEPTFVANGGLYYVENTGNVIDAGTGDDYVGAGAAADIVHGGDGDDDIYGMGGADMLFGDAGSDFIRGDGSATSGMGVTTQPSEHGADIIGGGAGRDVLQGQGGNDELYDGTEDDHLYSDDTEAVDTPVAIYGNDQLWGDGNRAGAVTDVYQNLDYLDGEDGNDQLTGGGNEDQLFGGNGNDLLWGDASNAGLASADNGADYLDGEAGDDLLAGDRSADTALGGEGNDALQGSDRRDSANDTLFWRAA